MTHCPVTYCTPYVHNTQTQDLLDYLDYWYAEALLYLGSLLTDLLCTNTMRQRSNTYRVFFIWSGGCIAATRCTCTAPPSDQVVLTVPSSDGRFACCTKSA